MAGEVPGSWVGEEVEVGLVVPAGWDEDTTVLRPLSGEYKTGVLEAADERGIVGAFHGTHDAVLGLKEPSRATFYPWSAVLSIHPLEDDD